MALRLIYGLSQDHAEPYNDRGGDSAWYLANGYALATGFEQGTLEGYGAGQYPISLKNLPTPPLYLLMIGFAQRILPHETAIIAIRFIQIMMSVTTCYFAYRLAAAIAHDDRAGLIAAGVLITVGGLAAVLYSRSNSGNVNGFKTVPVVRGSVVEKALAARLGAAPRTSVRLAKRTLRAGLERTLAQCLAAETEAQAACWTSPDSDEGIRAFVEKRAPAFGRDEDAAPEAAAPAAMHRFE